ncbi:hypothetical protein B0H63DRAFT_450393 [Podospora didyma]|uniref:Uncharacterized protein n=1 Tax=Podospora didyma TaxID=330526 RepID=A0AAE0NGD7_9PEZI|nr:hypothetical protein B0H63DRAFT_450393 [Podospora didyma]
MTAYAASEGLSNEIEDSDVEHDLDEHENSSGDGRHGKYRKAPTIGASSSNQEYLPATARGRRPHATAASPTPCLKIRVHLISVLHCKVFLGLDAIRRYQRDLVKCQVCRDEVRPYYKMVKLGCGCYLRHSCLGRKFTLFITVPQLMPPDCCSQSIPKDYVHVVRDKDGRRLWRKKYVEYRNRQDGPSSQRMQPPFGGFGDQNIRGESSSEGSDEDDSNEDVSDEDPSKG